GVERTRAAGLQSNRSRDGVVVVTAPCRKREAAVQLAVVARRDLVDPFAAVHAQTRLGTGCDRACDCEGDDVVAVATLHVSTQGTGASGGQSDGGSDRVVAVP